MKPLARAALTRTALALAFLLPPLAAHAQTAPAVQAADPAKRAELTAMIEAAKKEGQVSFLDGILQPQSVEAMKGEFRKYYGLPDSFQINYTLTSSSGVVTRLDQELAAGRVTIDVASTVVLPWLYKRIDDKSVMKYDSPEYANYKTAFSNGMGMPGYFAFDGAYAFIPMWNNDSLKYNSKSWTDVLKQPVNGRLTIGDASKSPSHLLVYMGLRKQLGKDFFEKVATLKPSLLVRSEQIAARLVSGEDLFALSGMAPRAYQANKLGAKLEVLYPQEGVVLQPQATFILAKAPHPSAAKLWLDFILSEKGQTILVQQEALISGRDGFNGAMPPYSPRIETIKMIPMDWKAITDDEMNKARDEWKSIFMK